MAKRRLRLFGPPQLEADGRPLELGLRRALAIVAYLAVTGQPHSRDLLATLFWPDVGQREARANLRRTFYQIGQALGKEALLLRTETVELNPNFELWLDVAAFQQLLAGTPITTDATAPLAETLPRLTKAVELYTDEFMSGFTLPDCREFDDWQFFQREALRHLLARTLELLTTAHSQEGRFDQAISYARRWLALDPLHEPVHQWLMKLYAWSGQQAAALRQYEECKRLLDEELGGPPSEATTAIYEAIRTRQLAPSANQPLIDSQPSPAPVQGPESYPLPVAATPFVGREQAITELLAHLQQPDCRLLTLVGPGGIGKTRLALAVAQRLLAGDDRLTLARDGLCFVPLAPVQTIHGLTPAIGEALGIQFAEGARLRRQLLAFLAQKELVLILDNFEHLLAGVDLLAEILAAAPGVKLVVTSREALNLQEEWFYPVPGMPSPPYQAEPLAVISQYDAVQLFEQCALRAAVTFSLAEEATHVVRICQLVGGMPLALELAASWLRVLPAAAIAAELAQGLDILTAHQRNIPERHRSLRVVFDTSWQLLAQAEQAAFARLSVFRGKFTLQAAQRVADLTLPLLSTLVNKALLQREGDGRYSIHELLRQYAAEQLAAHPPLEAQLRGRHAGFYAAFLQARRGELQAERQGEALSAIAGQLENSLAGWEYALERLGDDDERLNLVDRYVDALFHFFDIRSQYRLGEELLRKAAMAVSTPTSPTDLPLRRRILLGKILSRQGWFLFHLGQVTQAQALLQQSAERLLAAGARAEAVFALNYLGALHRHQGDSVAARHCLNQSLTLCREINDRLGQSIALNILGQIAYLEEAYDEAQRFCHESLAIKRAIGDRWGAVFSLSYLGAVASSRGDLAEARRLIEESMAISHALGDRRGLASSLCALGELAQRQGHFQSAQHDYTQSLALYTEIHNLLGATVVRTRLGDLARQQDNGAEACGYLHEALATAQRLENLPQILEILLVVARLWRSLAGPATPLLQLLADHPVASKRQKSEAQALLAELAETAPRTQPAQPADLATEAALTTLINQTLGQLSRAISRTYA